MSNPPAPPFVPLVLVFVGTTGVFLTGGALAGFIALGVVAPLASAYGFLALRRALYLDGYLADHLPDGRGQHGRRRWRVGVVDAPASRRAPAVQWITPKGGAE